MRKKLLFLLFIISSTVSLMAQSCTCTGNLLQCPSFESSSCFTSEWSLDSNDPSNVAYSSATIYAVCGTYYGYFRSNPYVASSYAAYYQNIPATVGSTYNLSAYAGVYEVDIDVQLKLQFYNSSNVLLSGGQTVQIDNDVDVTGALALYNLSAVAPAGTSYVKVTMFSQGLYTDEGTWAKFDNMCLTAMVCVPPSISSVSTTQPTCAVPSGTIVVNATGSGTLEYSINGGTTWQTSNTFSSLAPGSYTPKVRLQSNITCFTTGTAVTINAVPVAPVVSASTVTQPTCAVPSGTIVVNATGSGTLEYSINGGATWVTTNTFSGLAPGSYTPRVRLQSSTTCSTTGTAVTINAVPVAPVVSASTVTQPTCAVPSGTIVVNATGSGTLDYSINGGATWVTTNTFSGLAPGSYTPRVRLQSSTTCSTTGTAVTINAVPVAPVVSASTVTQPTCAVSTGTIVVNATGSGTLEYSINGGTTWVTTNTFSGLAPGNYTPRVRLQSSPTCSTTGTAVTINAVPVIPDIVTAPTITPINCASSTSGVISINATGSGVLEYSINAGVTWQTSNSFTGLSVGSYNVYVRLQSSVSCVKIYESNPIVLTAPTCRDFTPTIEIDNITFLPNTPARDFVINISELLNGASSGQIVLKIPKISGFTYAFSPTMTNANVNGGTAVNNSAWTKTENSLFITLTLNTGQVLSGFGIYTIGMTVQRNLNVPTQTYQPMTVTIVDGTGGDLNPYNNTYNVVIKAQ